MIRRPSRAFTAADAARRWWYCSPELVEEFLQDFTEQGLVEKVGGRWRVTPEGYEIASALSVADDRQKAVVA